MTDFLIPGDIIRLEKGMCIGTQVPICAYYNDRPCETGNTYAVIKIGDIYQIPALSRNQIAERMKEVLFKEFGVKITEVKAMYLADYAQIPVRNDAKVFDTSIYEGEYVVSKADIKKKSLLPRCHVTCYKKDNPSIEVDFHQNSRYYKNSIVSIVPIGHI